MTDQSADIPNVQIGEPGVFLGLLTRSLVVEGLLEGPEMTHKKPHHQSPPTWVTDTKSRNPWYTVQLVGK